MQLKLSSHLLWWWYHERKPWDFTILVVSLFCRVKLYKTPRNVIQNKTCHQVVHWAGISSVMFQNWSYISLNVMGHWILFFISLFTWAVYTSINNLNSFIVLLFVHLIKDGHGCGSQRRKQWLCRTLRTSFFWVPANCITYIISNVTFHFLAIVFCST